MGKISGDGKIQRGRFRLGGLIAAPYTAFENDGALRLGTIEKQARLLLESGVSGAFICGTTGEGISMTTAERMDVAQRWVAASKGTPLKVIVHVGHNSQRDAIALASHAAQIGADAIGSLPPSFYKPTTIDQLVDFLRPIAAAGSGLPFYYYHLPSMTGVTLSMADLLQVGGEHIPHLHGIKFTHGDLMEYQRCLKVAGEEYEIAWGVDEMLLGALAVGARSAVGSTYNYAAPLYHRMIGAFRRGDLDAARKCAAQSVEMVAVLLKYGVLRTGKATMAMLGLDCGPTRAPVPPLTGEEFATVRRTYERIGLFDFAAAPKGVSVSISPQLSSTPHTAQPT